MPIEFKRYTLYDINELSEKFNIAPHTIRDYLKAGKLKGRKMGKRWYVSDHAIEEYFNTPAIPEELNEDDKDGDDVKKG